MRLTRCTRSRIGVCAAVGALFGSVGADHLLAAEPPWIATDVVTSIQLNPALLEDLGVAVISQDTTATAFRDGYLGFAADGSSELRFFAPGADFEGFDSGRVRHEGGVVLGLPDGSISLLGFELHPASPPANFELLDAEGHSWFLLSHGHPHLLTSEAELRLLNMDLSISRTLADRLHRSDLAGTMLGTADVVARVVIPEPAQLSSACVGDFSADTDVALTSLDVLSQVVREDGRVALAPSATLENTGVADVPWFRAIAPDDPVGQHPYLVMSVYRIAQGRIQQIGRSDVKHTFYAVNSGCPCPSSQILYAGCRDTYGASTNANRKHFGPRHEVLPGTGEWESLGSHFDDVPVDDFRDHGGDDEHDAFEHRLTVAETDLQTSDARYYADAWYVVQNDIDIFNSMGYREVVPTFSGNVWTFPFEDDAISPGSVLDAWVDPLSPAEGSANTLVDTVEGHLKLAVRTTPLGGGFYWYEYALMNFDFDRAIGSFSVPIANGVTAAYARFSDVDDDPDNDWVADVQVAAVRWDAPPGHALGWGLLYNFGFIANANPGHATAILGAFAPGDPSELAAATFAPAGPGSAVNLSLTGACPGRMRFDVSGGSPYGLAALLSSSELGAFQISRGNCAGVELELHEPRLMTVVRFDTAGDTSLEITLPGSACGALLQPVDLRSCQPGNVISIP